MTSADLAKRRELLSKAFTPHKPISVPAFLAGRVDLQYKTSDALDTEGLHVILYGDRGTGKTSIARVVAVNVQEAEIQEGRRALLASCTTSDTYSSIWRKVFQQILVAERQLGFGQDAVVEVTGRFTVDQAITDPNDVRLVIESHPSDYVIIIDEFDRVPYNSDARRLMADTIKLFSDHGTRSKLVIVGVAASVGELIGEHPSIRRNISQIKVEPMNTEELGQIIIDGFARAQLKHQDSVALAIAMLSQGYPAYTHLLGLWSGRQALAAGDDTVTLEHLRKSIPLALEGTEGGAQQAYEDAVSSPRAKHLFKEVLLACALAPKDSLGRFKAVDLKMPLQQITGDVYDSTAAYQTHLAKFCEPQRGPILKRTGSRRNYSWQFIDPQVIPFITLKGKTDNLID